ncbi:MAG: glycogen synthase GlgA [Zavarzinella sp.]
MRDEPLSILIACSEVVGFAKTGGLADVAGYLPKAIQQMGHRVAVIMPLYRCVRQKFPDIRPVGSTLSVPCGRSIIPTQIYEGTLPNSNIAIYFVENEGFFERDDIKFGTTIYQYTNEVGKKVDYGDNCQRFAFFNRAIMESLTVLPEKPDIIHANDWQTGLIPVFLRESYRHLPSARGIKSLFTIHNLAYQGRFHRSDYPYTGLDYRLFNHQQMEFYGDFSFLKGGIVFSDWVNTVSPTYANEIRTTTFGCGMEGILRERRDRLNGIVNGVDYTTWNPETDPHLPKNYDVNSFQVGKAACKAAIQRHFSLPTQPDIPLIGMVARLVEQKGVDLVVKAADDLLKIPTQMIVLGEGDQQYHEKLQAIQARYPDKVGLLLGFNEELAHQIEAGSDLFLMPSQFEPSGLNQLYSLRYGTPPIVRTTGGLADTIIDATEESLVLAEPNGFRFQAYTPQALTGTVRWATHLYHERPETFRRIIRNGMQADWSWERAARGYEKIYRRLVAERAGRSLVESA